MLTDTHCHLDFNSFDADREAVLDRSRQTGVTTILDPGIDILSSRTAVALAEAHPGVYAAVGVHPNEACGWDTDTVNMLRHLASHPKVVAIGEIGLDFYRQVSSPADQRRIFVEQLALAGDLGLPVIVHSRQSMDQVLEVLSDWVSRLICGNESLAQHPGVLHSFDGTLDQARRAIQLGFYIGVTGPVTYKNAKERRGLISALPLDRLLTETDAPFLPPQPHRGQRNEPTYLRYIVDAIAASHQVPMSTVADITSSNAARIFTLGVSD